MARPVSTLDVARARIRRAQLTVGLGFIALVIGKTVSLNLLLRIGPRIQAVDSPAVSLIATTLVLELWVLAVLPGLCYLIARVIPIRPLPTAIGAALTGELLLYAIAILSSGLAGAFAHPGELALNTVTAALGVLLTMWAIKAALAQKTAAEEDAQKASVEKKSEYEEFTKEAERLAALRDKPPADAAPAPAVPPESAAPPASDAAPAGAVPPASDPPSGGTGTSS